MMAERRQKIHRKDVPSDFTGTLMLVKPKERRFMTERMTVDDRSTSVSCWTMSMMCKYFGFRRDVADWHREHNNEQTPEVKTEPESEDRIERVFNDYERIIMLHPNASSIDGILSFSESDVKSALTTLVSHIAQIHHLRMRMEHTIDLDCYPSCRLDYLLTYRDVPIGCVEAKRKSTLDKKAFAQAVIQLVVLQQWAYKHGDRYSVDMTKVPIFIVLSDGKRFILMKLRQCTLYVEKAWPVNPGVHRYIRIRHVTGMRTFSKLFKVMLSLCHDAINELEKQLDPPTPTQDEIPFFDLLDACRQKQRPEIKLSLKPDDNEMQWNEFLHPLTVSFSKKMKVEKPKHDLHISKDTIEGPNSLSRAFGTKLADNFIKLSEKERVQHRKKVKVRQTIIREQEREIQKTRDLD